MRLDAVLREILASMGRLDSAFHNFANHVTSGLSGFVTAAHDACDLASLDSVEVQLLPAVHVPPLLQQDFAFNTSVAALRAKFEEILAKQSGVDLNQLSSLTIHLDFMPDESRVRDRREKMMLARVHYGYSPVYRCTISLRELSEKERHVTIEDVE